jgi:hypothetical protein
MQAGSCRSQLSQHRLLLIACRGSCRVDLASSDELRLQQGWLSDRPTKGCGAATPPRSISYHLCGPLCISCMAISQSHELIIRSQGWTLDVGYSAAPQKEPRNGSSGEKFQLTAPPKSLGSTPGLPLLEELLEAIKRSKALFERATNMILHSFATSALKSSSNLPYSNGTSRPTPFLHLPSVCTELIKVRRMPNAMGCLTETHWRSRTTLPCIFPSDIS